MAMERKGSMRHVKKRSMLIPLSFNMIVFVHMLEIRAKDVTPPIAFQPHILRCCCRHSFIHFPEIAVLMLNAIVGN